MSDQHAPGCFLAEGSNPGEDGASSEQNPAPGMEPQESPFSGAMRRAMELCESTSWSSHADRKEELVAALVAYDAAERLATNTEEKVEALVLRCWCHIHLALELHALRESSGCVTEQLLHSLSSQKRAVELGWHDDLPIKEACSHAWYLLKEEIKDLDEEDKLDITRSSLQHLTAIQQRSECVMTIASIHLTAAMETFSQWNMRGEIATLRDTRSNLRHLVSVAQRGLQDMDNALGPEVIHPALLAEE